VIPLRSSLSHELTCSETASIPSQHAGEPAVMDWKPVTVTINPTITKATGLQRTEVSHELITSK
jgi:hypothetical protein